MWRVEFYPKEIDQDIGINYQLLSPDVLDIPRVFTLSIVNTEGRQVCVQESEPLYFSKFKKIELNFFSKTELFGPDREKYMPDNLLRVSCKVCKLRSRILLVLILWFPRLLCASRQITLKLDWSKILRIWSMENILMWNFRLKTTKLQPTNVF